MDIKLAQASDPEDTVQEKPICLLLTTKELYLMRKLPGEMTVNLFAKDHLDIRDAMRCFQDQD